MSKVHKQPRVDGKFLGEVARTELLAAARAPAWFIRADGWNSVANHAAGPPLALWFDDDDDEDDAGDGYTITTDGVAIIPVLGVLLDSEPTWWSRYLGYASLPQIARNVAAADADARVKDIFLDVDSPGGQACGTFSAADAVWAVRQRGEKRVWAGCRQVCSAAYAIASQCDRVYIAQDGMGGCIGTLITLSDWSGYYSEMGIVKYRITSSGAEAFKGAGSLGTEITTAQRADFKRVADEYQALFSAAVMRGRGFDEKTTGALADGRVHIGANAQALQLVDGVASPAAVLSALSGGPSLDPPASSDPPPEDGTAENTSQKDTTAAQSGTEEKTVSDRVNALLAWLKGDGDDKTEGNTPPVNTTPDNTTATAQAGQNSQADPRLAVLDAAGITTPEQVTSLKADAEFKGKYETRLKAECQRLAVMSGQAHLSDVVATFTVPQLEAFELKAGHAVDDKYGITETEGAQRTTTPADPAEFAQSAGGVLTAEQLAQQKEAGRRAYENRTGKKLAA